MKSLEARQAQRAEQREANGRNEVEGEDVFNAEDWVADSVPNIVSQLETLSNDELDAVEAAEKGLKGRVGVLDGVAAERKRREGEGSGWNNNAG